jgi:putative tricarboxylic transport membrane protein
MDLIFGLFCALIMCDIALRLVGVVFIRYAQRITTGIPTSLIFPGIIVLCIFGSFSINNDMFDVLIMLIFGIVGYAMAVFEISAVPFLIAFVLAPMLERGLRRSLAVSGGDPMIFFRSPIAVVFFILTALVILSIARGMFRRMK